MTVIMSVYNELVNDLRQSIESILNQSYRNFEFIIIFDNPRNSKLGKVLQEYAYDSRIKLITNEENLGLAACLNYGIMIANGEYIVRMDADDISNVDRLKCLESYINKEIDVYFSMYEIMDEKGNFLKISERMPETNRQLYKIMKFKNIICHPTVMFKRESILATGGYSTLNVSEDYELWMRLLSQGYIFKGINESLVKYRVRQNSMTTSDYFRSYFSILYINKYFNKGNNLPIRNEDFYSTLKNVKINKKRFNLYALKYNSLVNNWKNIGVKRYFSLAQILFFEPKLIGMTYRTFMAKRLRRKN